MKKGSILLGLLAVFVLTVISCTPQNQVGDDYQDEVDKDKVERPGNQGGN
jgi:hypothetical protein